MEKSKVVSLLCGVFAAPVIAAPVIAAEVVEVAVVVEPSVYQSYPAEMLNSMLVKQFETANRVHGEANTGVRYNLVAVEAWKNDVVSEELAQGYSFSRVASEIMYSIRYDADEFAVVFQGHPWFTDYEPLSRKVLAKYGADTLLFVTAGTDQANNSPIAQSFENFGVIASVHGLAQRGDLLAHEWGHHFGLGHPSAEECNQTPSLMCQGFDDRGGFSVSELKVVEGIVDKNEEFYLPHFDPAHYLGWYSAPLPKLGSVKFSVADNPVPHGLNETEVTIELVNEAGDAVAFDTKVSVELYTSGVSAIAGEHYSEDVYQRVDFAPGENVKRIDFPVTHGSIDAVVKTGTRYGTGLTDSATVDVTIKANPDTGSGNEPDAGGDSGGSLGGFALGILGMLVAFRRKTH